MAAVRDSPLFLSCGIDPIGIDHTNEEIVERIVKFREYQPKNVCVMRRINVPGTPMEGVEEVSDLRMAHIAAVVRIAGGRKWNVAVHPMIRKALDWGASVIAVETGANPRANMQEVGVWKICDRATARQTFIDAGYDLLSPDDLPSP